MSEARRITLVLAAVAIAAICALYAYSRREPTYDGKRLSAWLDEGLGRPGFDNQVRDPAPAREAVRALGKKAIPTLLRMIQTKDSPFKRKLRALAAKQTWGRLDSPDSDAYQGWGAEGIGALGPDAREALPELIRLFHDPDLAERAAIAMGAVSFDAVQVLRSGLSNKDERIRSASARGLGLARFGAAEAIPDLTRTLTDSCPVVRDQASGAIQRLRAHPAYRRRYVEFVAKPVNMRDAANGAWKPVSPEPGVPRAK